MPEHGDSIFVYFRGNNFAGNPLRRVTYGDACRAWIRGCFIIKFVAEDLDLCGDAMLSAINRLTAALEYIIFLSLKHLMLLVETPVLPAGVQKGHG